MIEIVDPHKPTTLDDYAEYIQLRPSVEELREEAERLTTPLEGRTLWMVNSTASGGGVAEMMPKLVALLNELGLDTEWAVIQPQAQRFFDLTKHLHNLIHDSGPSRLSGGDRALYESVSEDAADALEPYLSESDLLAVHDPQPLGMGAILKDRLGLPTLWRCHIGLDRQTDHTRAAWDFLRPFAEKYDRTVFSISDYVPEFLDEQASVIPPAIDPLSHKNRDLSVHKVSGVLANAGLARYSEVLTPDFEPQAERLQTSGDLGPATSPGDLGLPFRPAVTQISRWDRLKGWVPLLQGFARMKERHYAKDAPSGGSNGAFVSADEEHPERHHRRLDLVRLILAGPDPESVADDPEGQAAFEQICLQWKKLDPRVQRDVAILALPMDSRKENALMVNALQRCATVVAQNSLQEGFGLTATEAMWKSCPVMGTRAVGLRTQIRDGVDGRLVENAEDADEVAETLDAMLSAGRERQAWARNARRRVADEYLVFGQAERWLETLARVGEASAAPVRAAAS
ncbi:MAG: glycosyl transferase family 1 [Bacteroidetes bacterium QS_9_68_14]|nr:MAG: glycosyl transferase family 1 [Bacteroidetes bacterium QS_9_68_14]